LSLIKKTIGERIISLVPVILNFIFLVAAIFLVRVLSPIFKLNEIIIMPDYVIPAILLVLSSLLVNFIFYKKKFVKLESESFKNYFLWFVLGFLLIFSFFIVSWEAFIATSRVFLLSNPIVWLLGIFFLCFIFFYEISKEKMKHNISKYVLLIILLGVSYISYHVPFNELHRYNENAQNFQIVLHAIVQVYLGKILYYDLISQYGGFPFFIKPILLLTGASVLSVSSIFAFILMTVFLIWAFILYKVVENKSLVLVGFFAYVYIHLFSTGLWPYQLTFFYYPIRILFPALMILTSFFYFKNTNNRNFLLTTFILSLGIVWNADVGIICFLAFTFVSAFDKFCNEEILLIRLKFFIYEALKCFIIPIILLFFISLCYKLTLGSWADYTMQFAVHEYYIKSRTTLGMTRLALDGTWIFIILTYLFSLNYSVYYMLRRNDYIDRIILLLTIFGIGSFSYHAYTYVPQVAARVSYPAIIIIILFLDKLLKRDNLNMIDNFKTRKYFKSPTQLISFLLIFFFSFCSALLVMEYKIPVNSEHVKIHEFYFKDSKNSKSIWYVQGPTGKKSSKAIRMSDYFANPNINPRWIDRSIKIENLMNKYNIGRNEKIIIFSTWDAYIYMKIKVKSPLSIANSYHIMQANQGQEVLDYIASRQADWIFFDKDPFLLHAKLSYWTKDIPDVLDMSYNEIETVPLMDNYHDGWNETALILYKKQD